LAVLFEAVAAAVSRSRLTLTEIGRRFGGVARCATGSNGRIACSATAIYSATAVGSTPH